MKCAVVSAILILVLSGCYEKRTEAVDGDYIVSGFQYAGPPSLQDTFTNVQLHITAHSFGKICENVLNECLQYKIDLSNRSVYVFKSHVNGPNPANYTLQYYAHNDSIEYTFSEESLVMRSIYLSGVRKR